MTEQNATTGKIYFLENTSDIIFDILKKYSLQETPEELEKLEEKLIKENPEPYIFRGEIILNIAISLVKKELTETDAISALQKELNVSQTIATDLVNEIKLKLISIATTEKPVVMEEKIAETQIKIPKEKDSDIFPNINPTIDIQEIKTQDKTTATTPQKKERAKKFIPTEEIKISQPPPSRPSGPDNYREPIE